WCGVLASLSFLRAQDSCAERRLLGVGLQVFVVGSCSTRTDEEGFLIVFVAVVVNVNNGADSRNAVLNTFALSGGISQNLGDLFDAGLFLVLHLTRSVVASVLLEVAFFTALVNLRCNLRATVNEHLQLSLELRLRLWKIGRASCREGV